MDVVAIHSGSMPLSSNPSLPQDWLVYDPKHLSISPSKQKPKITSSKAAMIDNNKQAEKGHRICHKEVQFWMTRESNKFIKKEV
jgi:hypothetical protein